MQTLFFSDNNSFVANCSKGVSAGLLPTRTRTQPQLSEKAEAEFLDEIQTKLLRVFLLGIHSLQQLCLRFIFLQTHATSYNYCKGEWVLYGLRNPYRNLKFENSQDYAQKPQRDCMFMNTASGVSSCCVGCRLQGRRRRGHVDPRGIRHVQQLLKGASPKAGSTAVQSQPPLWLCRAGLCHAGKPPACTI
jgi:hypothetical protein